MSKIVTKRAAIYVYSDGSFPDIHMLITDSAEDNTCFKRVSDFQILTFEIKGTVTNLQKFNKEIEDLEKSIKEKQAILETMKDFYTSELTKEHIKAMHR